MTPLAVAGLRQSSAPSGRVVGTAPTNPQETLQPQSCTEIANRLYLGEVSDHTPKPTVLLLCTIQHASGAADLRSMLLVEATTARTAACPALVSCSCYSSGDGRYRLLSLNHFNADALCPQESHRVVTTYRHSIIP